MREEIVCESIERDEDREESRGVEVMEEMRISGEKKCNGRIGKGMSLGILEESFGMKEALKLDGD